MSKPLKYLKHTRGKTLIHSIVSTISRYQLLLLGISATLTSISFVLTPTIDYPPLLSSSEYPLFYASRLPISYYLAIPILALLVLSPNRLIRLASCIMLAVLVEFTPSLMLSNPWTPDQYPFLAEAVWLEKNHFIANFHYLGETPGLGLMFSQLAIVCNLDPFQISKIFPLLTVFFMIFIFLLVEKLGGNGGLGVCLFLAFNVWYNINVFQRQSFSFALFLLLIYALTAISTSRAKSFVIPYLITFLTIAISHPGTTAFFIIALGVYVLGVYVSRSRQEQRHSTILSMSFIIFFLWHYHVSGDFMKFFSYAWTSLMNLFLETANPPGMAYLAMGYTETFRVILSIRILVTMVSLLLAILASFYLLFFMRGKRGLMLTSLIFGGFALEFIAYIYLAPWSRLRPLLFLVYASAIPVSIVLSTNISSTSKHRYKIFSTTASFISKNRQKMLIPIVIFAILLLALVPILRYSGIPYLHPSTQELYSKAFISEFYFSNEGLMTTESNLPYFLDEVLLDRKNFVPLEPLQVPQESIYEGANYWIINRFLTRDGYYIYSLGYRDFLEELCDNLPSTHNLVYMNDRYGAIFIAR